MEGLERRQEKDMNLPEVIYIILKLNSEPIFSIELPKLEPDSIIGGYDLTSWIGQDYGVTNFDVPNVLGINESRL